MLIPLVLRVHSQRRIAQQRLRTGGCHNNALTLGTAHQRILDVPEMACLLHMLHLSIGNGGVAHRAPVDDPVSFINITLVVQVDKNFLYGLGAALVHGKPLSVPVCGRTHLFQLADDPAAVLFLPVPGALQELLPAQIFLLDAFLFQCLDDLHLCGDAGVVCARLPECIEALHSLVTDENILHGVVQGMSHVQLTGDVRRRHHDGKRLLAAVYLRVKILLIQPFLIQTAFNPVGVIGLFQIFLHDRSPFLNLRVPPVPCASRPGAPHLSRCFRIGRLSITAERRI